MSMHEMCKCSEVIVVTADTCVCDEPGFLMAVVLTPNASAAATCVLYDGFSTDAKTLLPMTTITSFSKDIALREPVFFGSGLFIDVGSNVTGVMVHFVRDRVVKNDLYPDS